MTMEKQFVSFLKDEQMGSVSIYSLGWFTGFCMFVGLAVDSSAAIQSKAKLQWTADATAHAAVQSIIPYPAAFVVPARDYPQMNQRNDDTVKLTDVIPGYWIARNDTSAALEDRGTFNTDLNEIPHYNAVAVRAARNVSRANALMTTFMYFAGLPVFTLEERSIAYMDTGDDPSLNCLANGLVAAGEMEQTANNEFTRNICVHGEQLLKLTMNNVIQCGVEMSTGIGFDENEVMTWKGDIQGPMNDPVDENGDPKTTMDPDSCTTFGPENEYDQAEFEQSFMYRSLPAINRAEFVTVGNYIQGYIACMGDGLGCDVWSKTNTDGWNDPIGVIPPYLGRTKTPFYQKMSVQSFNNLAKLTGNKLVSGLVPGTIYDVSCASNGNGGGNGGKDLVLEGIVKNVAIITDCFIEFKKNRNVSETKATKYQNPESGILVECDTDLNDCPNTGWIIELDPMKSCADNVAATEDVYPGDIYYTGQDTLYSGQNGLAWPSGFDSDLNTVETFYRDGETPDPDGQHKCAVEPGANGVMENVLIYSTYSMDDPSKKAFKFPNNMQIGRVDGCNQGGSVRIYAAGSLDTPSGTVIHGSGFYLLGDAHLAAKMDGVNGVVIQAQNISYAAKGRLSGCSPDSSDGESDLVVATRTPRIVD